ncbi:MAG: DsbA family protein [Gemmatimonadota bacterium]|jgi:predicted DsbA family dithiol-disulfide isomerase
MSESGPLVLFYDYVDPASYLLELRLRERGYFPGSNLQPLPLELNPPHHPLLDPNRREWKDHRARAMTEAQAMGLAFTPPWIIPWTRKAHELVYFAAEGNRPLEIHEALFRAYLEDGLDIGRVDVLVALGEKHGLDAMEAKAALDVDKYGEAVGTIRSRAMREGVVRPTTLRLNGRTLHGSPTPEALDAFLAAGGH